MGNLSFCKMLCVIYRTCICVQVSVLLVFNHGLNRFVKELKLHGVSLTDLVMSSSVCLLFGTCSLYWLLAVTAYRNTSLLCAYILAGIIV